MRIFLTGATGFVGSAVLSELLAAGHQVLGLARNDKAAEALTAAGAEVHRGDIEDLDSLRRGAAAADAIIHTGFIHDFSRFAECCQLDRAAIEAMGGELTGTEKPFVITSGVGLIRGGGLVTESAKAPHDSPNPRIASELAADGLAAQGVRVSVMRLAPSVHGAGDHGFVPILIGIARDKGLSVYSSAGISWCAVHRLDAAKLYRLAVEATGAAPGTRYNGVAEGNIPFKDIAAVIGKRLNVPVEEKSPEEAAQHFGWFAHFAAMNIHASSQQTQESLGWKPEHTGLIADIDSEAYFPSAPASGDKS